MVTGDKHGRLTNNALDAVNKPLTKKVTTTKTVSEEVQFAPVAISDYRPVALRLCMEESLLEFGVLPEPNWLAALLGSGKVS